MAAGHKIGTIFVEVGLDYEPYTRAQKNLLRDATSSTRSIEGEFSKLRIHSSRELDLMRAKAENAYIAIANSSKSTANDILRAEQAKNAQLTRINEMQFGKQVSFLSQIRTHWLGVTAAIGSMAILRNVTMDIINTGVAAERMNLSLKAATGGVEAATSAHRYLSEESERLGLLFEGQVSGYVKIAAAAKGTSLEGQSVRNIWRGIATAGAALQMSNSDVEGSLLAVSQMISKGKVSAEELRQQLGERLPGAFQIAARAMDMTTMQLDDALKKGQIYADDFLPKFAQALEEQYGQAAVDASDSATAAMNRYHNSMWDLKVTLSDHLLPVFTSFVKLLDESIKHVNSDGFAKAMAVQVGGGALMVDEFGRPVGGGNVLTPYKGGTPLSVGAIPPTVHYTDFMGTPLPAPVIDPKAAEKAAKEAQKAQDEWLDNYLKSVDTAWKAEVERNEGIGDLVNVEMKWKDEAWKQEQADAKEAAKMNEKLAGDRADAYRNMYKDLGKSSERYYDAELDALRLQADKYRELGVDQNTVNTWLANEEKKTLRQRGLEHGSFFDGMRIGMEESTERTVTWAQTGKAIYDQFAADAKASLSNNLFHAIKGDFDEFELDWESMWDNMLHIMTDAIAEMAVDAGAKLAKDVLGEIGGWARSIFFHEGSWNVGAGLAADEYPAILQQGEMVIPVELAKRLRAIWSSSASATAAASSQYATFLEGLSTEAANMPGAYGLTSQSYVGALPVASYTAAYSAAEASAFGAMTGAEAAAGASAGSAAPVASLSYWAGPAAVVAMPLLSWYGGRSSSRKAKHAWEDWYNSLDPAQQTAYGRYYHTQFLWDMATKQAGSRTINPSDPFSLTTPIIRGTAPSWLTPEMVFAPRIPVDTLLALPNAIERFRQALYNPDSWIETGIEYNRSGIYTHNYGDMYEKAMEMRYGENWQLDKWRRTSEGMNTGTQLSFATGTGPEGLPRTGWYYGHKKEIVLNNEQSDEIRRGKGGGVQTIMINSPIYLDGKIVGHFKKEVQAIADDVRVKAERRVMGSKRIYSRKIYS